MKRYIIYGDGTHEADETGSWVRAEDAEAEIARLRAVVEALPRCEACKVRSATHIAEACAAYMFCDHCSGPPDATELTYADALRSLADQ